MDIAIPLFDRFTALDAIGPYEVLQPPARRAVTFARRRAGPGGDRQRHAARSSPTRALEDCPHPDIVVVPGGIGTRALLDDERADRLGPHARTRPRSGRRRCAPARWCSAPPACSTAWSDHALAGAGHARVDSARSPTGQRVVEQGKIITAAGVSSGHRHGPGLAAQIAGDESPRRSSSGSSTTRSRRSTPARPRRRPREVVAICRSVEALIDAGQAVWALDDPEPDRRERLFGRDLPVGLPKEPRHRLAAQPIEVADLPAPFDRSKSPP